MIVELLGPGGVGKTTLEPLVAAGLGIAHYPAVKRHGFEGEPLTPTQVWVGRLGSAVRSPRTAVRLATGPPGDDQTSDSDSLSTCAVGNESPDGLPVWEVASWRAGRSTLCVRHRPTPTPT